MTAAKSRPKRQDELPKVEERRRPKEKATSSKPEKGKQELSKTKTKEVKPPMSTSPGPCTGECKEICQEGPKWERCGLTCKVQKEHASKDCRCKRHENRDKFVETKDKPNIDPILEACKKETRFRPPIQSQETIDEEKKIHNAQEERRLKEEFDKAQHQAQKTKEAYEKMMKEKKLALKSAKKVKEDSSSEEQRAKQKKFDSSSSEIPPKRRNMKPRCFMIRLKSAERATKRKGRPVLTERGGDTPSEVEIEGERTEETSSSSRPDVTEKPEESETSQGIYASEANRPMTLGEMFEDKEKKKGTHQNF
jgi:hypothetical protein